MSYVIVNKNNKKLHTFHSNESPIGYKRVYYTDRLSGQENFKYEKRYCSSTMFTFYKDSYTRYKSYDEAIEYIESMKNQVLKNEKRYEEFLNGSTKKLLKYIEKLRIIEDDGVFNG